MKALLFCFVLLLTVSCHTDRYADKIDPKEKVYTIERVRVTQEGLTLFTCHPDTVISMPGCKQTDAFCPGRVIAVYDTLVAPITLQKERALFGKKEFKVLKKSQQLWVVESLIATDSSLNAYVVGARGKFFTMKKNEDLALHPGHLILVENQKFIRPVTFMKEILSDENQEKGYDPVAICGWIILGLLGLYLWAQMASE